MEKRNNLTGDESRDRLQDDDALRTGARVPDGDENYDDEELEDELDDEEDDDELLDDDDDEDEDEEKDVI